MAQRMPRRAVIPNTLLLFPAIRFLLGQAEREVAIPLGACYLEGDGAQRWELAAVVFKALFVHRHDMRLTPVLLTDLLAAAIVQKDDNTIKRLRLMAKAQAEEAWKLGIAPRGLTKQDFTERMQKAGHEHLRSITLPNDCVTAYCSPASRV